MHDAERPTEAQLIWIPPRRILCEGKESWEKNPINHWIISPVPPAVGSAEAESPQCHRASLLGISLCKSVLVEI